MGGRESREENIEGNIEITPEKINNLENEIKTFIQNQSQNIFKVFSKEGYKKKNIGFTIDANNKIIKDEDFDSPKDYVIQWSVEGDYDINNTKCLLTFFNIGAFLGGEGILYSISLFYYYFMKIPCENRSENDIKNDIEKCLEYIDNGNIDELNLKWKVKLNKSLLNNLRTAKDFLINLFQEKVTDDIFIELSKSNILMRILKTCLSGISKFCVSLIYLLSSRIGKKENKNERNADYLKRKNRINKSHLPKLILDKIDTDFFANNNIFILALDDNTTPLVNYGIAFTGDYIKGLGEFHRARRLIEGEEDGFMTGNPENKNVYDFYFYKIRDIKTFFSRNADKIDKINRGIDINISIQEISKELDKINEKYSYEGIIDEEISRASTARESIYQQMGGERQCEYNRLKSGKVFNNICEITPIRQNNLNDKIFINSYSNVKNEEEKVLAYE